MLVDGQKNCNYIFCTNTCTSWTSVTVFYDTASNRHTCHVPVENFTENCSDGYDDGIEHENNNNRLTIIKAQSIQFIICM